MNSTEGTRDEDRNGSQSTGAVGRRRFVALGAGASATLLAGCSGATDSDGSTTDGDGTGGDSTTESGSDGSMTGGSFRLLISDQPADIGDFEELNVTLDYARVFRDEADDEKTETDGDAETEDGTETQDETETEEETTETAATETATTEEATTAADEEETADDEDDDEDDDEEDEDGERGFSKIDLDGATVDLTKVLGDKAISVFDGELPEGRYSKVELHVRNAEGIVDGETVGVKVPSGKLQIVKSFEVVAGESLSFVFDINVVKKGNTGEYNLLPVISESGVAGKDVNVEEVGGNDEDEDDENAADGADSDGTESDETESDDAESDEETTATAEDDGGSPDDAGGNSGGD